MCGGMGGTEQLAHSSQMNIPGFSLCRKSLRLRRFRWTMIRKATASSSRTTAFTEAHVKPFTHYLLSTMGRWRGAEVFESTRHFRTFRGKCPLISSHGAVSVCESQQTFRPKTCLGLWTLG